MNRNTGIILGIVVVIVIALIAFAMMNQTTAPTDTLNNVMNQEQATEEETNDAPATTTATSTPDTTGTQAKTYTLAEVAKHNARTDCWLAIEGKVYDVTPFIAGGRHPGGEAIVQGCGKDATVLFNTRPMGSGTAHSDRARSNLPNFYIGDLKK